jgi:hypothetical protein
MYRIFNGEKKSTNCFVQRFFLFNGSFVKVNQAQSKHTVLQSL